MPLRIKYYTRAVAAAAAKISSSGLVDTSRRYMRYTLYGVIAGFQHSDAAVADRASRRARHRYSHRRRLPASGERPYNGRQQHAPWCAGDVVPWLSRCGGRCDLRLRSCGEAVCRPAGGWKWWQRRQTRSPPPTPHLATTGTARRRVPPFGIGSRSHTVRRRRRRLIVAVVVVR